MGGVLPSPMVLGIDGFLSMNCFEPLFWMGTAYAVLRVVRGGDPRWWIAAGLAAGLGLENKWNEVFFLVALLVALSLTACVEDFEKPVVCGLRGPDRGPRTAQPSVGGTPRLADARVAAQ